MLSTTLTIITFLVAAWCSTSHGLHYDVACPGSNSELQCPPGQVIEVLSLQHGLQKDANCKARGVPATVSNKDCIHKGMLPWVKMVCDKIESCRLPKPHAKMFVCGYSNDTFLQITYNCKNKSAGVLTEVLCEGDDDDIECDNGVLNIVKASFGRLDKSTCTTTPSNMTFCTSAIAGAVVANKCNGKQSCELVATSAQLGQPSHCDSLPKYLRVDYVCQ